MHYLDYAATAPVCRPVADAMYSSLTAQFANPSAQYPAGQTARETLECHRAVIADALGAAAESIVFTSGGTESDNWAIRAAIHMGRHTGKHIITTAVEHSAVLEPLKALEQEGYEITRLRPDSTGHVSAAQVAQALRQDTVLVSMMLVNNETGCVFPIRETAELLLQRKSQALLHCDAVQGFMKVPCDPTDWGVDLMSLSAHKLGGPKGIGALYIAPERKNIRPLLWGGGQERGLRSGTEPTSQIAGFARAVELWRTEGERYVRHMAEMKDYALSRLLTIPCMERIGSGEAPHILLLSLPGYPSGNIITELGEQGICISAGSACHKGKPSHVIAAMGLPKRTAAGAFRVSFGPETTVDDLDALYAALRDHQARRFPML
ncbi:MAG: cysteine desulfurase [Oscillospiraceae bacterium]|nr:cysteine desulfurase [Oscillospiraceae bacterium]